MHLISCDYIPVFHFPCVFIFSREKAFGARETTQHGFPPDGENFLVNPYNRVLMIHTDWLPGMHLAPLAQKIVRAGARLLSACSLVVRALAGPVIMSQLQYLV